MDASGFVDKPEKIARKKVDSATFAIDREDEGDDDEEGLPFTLQCLPRSAHRICQ